MLLAFFEAMLSTLTTPALTLVLLGVIVSLGTALVWAFWEMEQASKSQRQGDQLR